MVLVNILSIFAMSFVMWLFLASYFLVAQNISRVYFILGHYAIVLIATAGCFYILYKYMPHLSPFNTMIVGMISVFIIEFIVFRFFYKGDLWFLNFVDWLVPVFIASTVMYFMGIYVKS